MCCLAKPGGSRFTQIDCSVTFIALDCKIDEDLKRCLSNPGEQVPYDVAPSQEDTDYLNGKVWRGGAGLSFSYRLSPNGPCWPLLRSE